MMISPEMYYEKYLKSKTVGEIMTVIRSLKREISRLKTIIERPDTNYEDIISPSEEVCLACARLYLERAKLALVEAGGVYIPSKAEKRAEEFDANIPFISKVEFCVGGFFHGYETRSYIIEGDTVKMEIDGISFWLDPIDSFIDKEIDKKSLFKRLADLHIGEWRRNYSPRRWGEEVLDGEQWHLYIYYSNGKRTVKIEGDNDYPYNFLGLLELFGLDETEEEHIQGMVEDFVEDLGATGYQQGRDWRGYQVYMPQYEDNPCIGLPYVILRKGREVRVSTPEECLKYFEYIETLSAL